MIVSYPQGFHSLVGGTWAQDSVIHVAVDMCSKCFSNENKERLLFSDQKGSRR